MPVMVTRAVSPNKVIYNIIRELHLNLCMTTEKIVFLKLKQFLNTGNPYQIQTSFVNSNQNTNNTEIAKITHPTEVSEMILLSSSTLMQSN